MNVETCIIALPVETCIIALPIISCSVTFACMLAPGLGHVAHTPTFAQARVSHLCLFSPNEAHLLLVPFHHWSQPWLASRLTLTTHTIVLGMGNFVDAGPASKKDVRGNAGTSESLALNGLRL